MANRIVKDSGLPIFVKSVQVLASGGDVATLPKINDLVVEGVKCGLVGDTPRKGDDGAFYANVDTAALVRLAAVSGAFTNGQIVYRNTTSGAISNAATGAVAIGYADRPKTAASGDLWVQLVPRIA